MASEQQPHEQLHIEEELQNLEQDVKNGEELFSPANLSNFTHEEYKNALNWKARQYAEATRTKLNHSWYCYLLEARTGNPEAVIAALKQFLILEKRLEKIEYSLHEASNQDGNSNTGTRKGNLEEGLKALPGDAASPTENGSPRSLHELANVLASADDPVKTFDEIASQFWGGIAAGSRAQEVPAPEPKVPELELEVRTPAPRNRIRILGIVALVAIIALVGCAILWLNAPTAPNGSATATTSILDATQPVTVASTADATLATVAASSAVTSGEAAASTTVTTPHATAAPPVETATIIATDSSTPPIPPTPTNMTSPSQPPSAPSVTPGVDLPTQPERTVHVVQGVREAYNYTDRIASDQFGVYTRLRSEPNVESSRGAYLRNTDQVQVLEARDSWYYIRILQNGDESQVGQEGWIERWLIDNELVPPTPTPVPPVVIPDVHGADVGRARTFLQQKGFRVAVSVLPSDQAGALCNGWVSYSVPQAGSLVKRGSLVRLFYRGFNVQNPPKCG